MIEIEKISITNGDYSVLKRNHVSENSSVLDCCLYEYIEDDIIEYLSKFIGADCNTIYVEYPYYDTDYLSNYYEFYSKKLRPFGKKCCRLLLYRENEQSNDEQGNDESAEDTKPEGELIGYISLRPTYRNRRIGRMFLNPKYCILKKDERRIKGKERIVHSGLAYIVAPKQKVHFYGTESSVRAAPHMTQEGDVTVCAHVALWSILRSFSNRFTMYPEVRIGNLVQMIQPESERLIPSHGLNVHQISKVLLDFGFTPVVRYEKNKAQSSDDTNGDFKTTIMDEILAYVDSGIPVIGVNPERQHAVAVVGRGEFCSDNLKKSNANAPSTRREKWWASARMSWDGKPEDQTFYLASRLVEELVVNDDNLFAYRFLETRTPSNDAQLTRFLRKKSDITGKHRSHSANEINGVIVPLYPRIQLDYDAVLNRFKALAESQFYKGLDELVVRIFLTSANTFREYVRRNKDAINAGASIHGSKLADCTGQIPSFLQGWNLSEILLKLELPKFIWFIEAALPQEFENGKTRSIVIFDSTSATVDNSPILFPVFPESDKSGESDASVFRIDFSDSEESQVPRFEDNLTRFERMD